MPTHRKQDTTGGPAFHSSAHAQDLFTGAETLKGHLNLKRPDHIVANGRRRNAHLKLEVVDLHAFQALSASQSDLGVKVSGVSSGRNVPHLLHVVKNVDVEVACCFTTMSISDMIDNFNGDRLDTFQASLPGAEVVTFGNEHTSTRTNGALQGAPEYTPRCRPAQSPRTSLRRKRRRQAR